MATLGAGKQYPDSATTDAEERIIVIERMMDTVGRGYEASCLQDCGTSWLCRDRAHLPGLATARGTSIARELPGVQRLRRAAELANGTLARPRSRAGGAASSLPPHRRRGRGRTSGAQPKRRSAHRPWPISLSPQWRTAPCLLANHAMIAGGASLADALALEAEVEGLAHVCWCA